MGPKRWRPPAELESFLEYTDDHNRVRCLICKDANLPGQGKWINATGLKQHLNCMSHNQNMTAREQRILHAAAHQADLDSAYAAPSSYTLTPSEILPTLRPSLFSSDRRESASQIYSSDDYHMDTASVQDQFSSLFTPPSTETADDHQMRINEQFTQMFLEALRNDGLDPELASEDHAEDLLDGGEESDDEDNAEDPPDIWENITQNGYWPYPNKTMMLFQLVDNLGRCRFSSSQLKLMLFLARQLGVADVPSYQAFRKFQARLRSLTNSEPQKHVSYLGNIFYSAHICEIIARDLSNRDVSSLLQFYPEEPSGPVEETWQAGRWKEFSPSQLTPMYSHGSRRFWIDELSQLKDGRFVIPRNWIVRNGALHSDVTFAEHLTDGWRLTGTSGSVAATEFEWDYSNVISQLGNEPLHWVDSTTVPNMPNPLRQLVEDDEDLYVIMVTPWADDVSGNRSKQYNKHMNMYVSNGCLPGRLLQQEFHVHYFSTSPYASSAEQFSAFRDQVRETEKTPYRCFNASTQRKCRFILRTPGLPADNPQQSEEACHMGSNASFPCRKCMWGGTALEKETKEKYHACHFVGTLRNAQAIKEALQVQISTAMQGVDARVELLQKASGTKDKVAQYWIEKLLAKARDLKSENPRISQDEITAILTKWLDEQPGDKMNPLLDITGLDPSQDTPVEILHTILLGIIKYIWHFLNTSQWTDSQRALFAIRLQSSDISGLHIPPLRAAYMIQYKNNLIGKHFKALMQLMTFHVHDIATPEQFVLVKAAADLGARLWITSINNMDEYLADLQVSIANVLDAFDTVDPLRILTKIKMHLLPHIVDDIRRFGPAPRFSTEVFEAYNAVFRLCSVLSNHLAPSRDISVKFSAMELVKHLFTGGHVLDPKTGRWRQAGTAVLRLLHDEPVFQRHLGWVPATPPRDSHHLIKPLPARQTPEKKSWSSTIAAHSTYLPSPVPTANSQWTVGLNVKTVLGDTAALNSWVVGWKEKGRVIIGRICELLIEVNGTSEMVVIETFLLSDVRHTEFDWPVLRRPTDEDMRQADVHLLSTFEAKDIRFVISVQHDCRRGSCQPTVIQRERQERQETNREVRLIAHADDNFFVLNMAGLHNFAELCRVLPRPLTKPVPLQSNREMFHYGVAESAQEIRSGRRKKSSEKRRAKADEKKKKAMQALADAEALLRGDESEEIESEKGVESEETNDDGSEAGEDIIPEAVGNPQLQQSRRRKRKKKS